MYSFNICVEPAFISFNDNIDLFFSSYEYLNRDNGEGLGASHQTGWTGCIVELLGVIDMLTSDNIEHYTNLATGTIDE